MDKMKPMKPMEPMKPFSNMTSRQWWPSEFGDPASSGSSDGLRYAYFPLKQRLVIQDGEKMATYETGNHQFRGALQAGAASSDLTFLSQHGRVALSELRLVS